MLRTLRNLSVLWLGLVLAPNLTYSQERKVLKELIVELEERFEVKFSYADADLDDVEIQLPNSHSLETILNSITEQTQIRFKKLDDRYYALTKPALVHICGRVLDNYANNTVSGATVEVMETEQALVTDTEGNFTLEGIPRKATLKIRYLGYVTKYLSVARLLGTDCPEILLAEHREQLDEVVVYQFLTTGIIREQDASISLNTSEFGILPGLIEPDVLQTVQALPGIKSIDETVSDINVRGGTNDQNLILWNGIKIYQSGHFFGLISAFNPYLIRNVSIYKNGTPSRYGDGVSSVISMDTENERTGRFSGGGGLNFITGDVYGQFPIKENLEFQFSARRSTTDFLNTPTYQSFTERAFQDSEVLDGQNQTINLEFERDEDFFFYDFSGKVLYDYNDHHKFRLSFIAMDNELSYVETDLRTDETTRSFLGQTNISIGLQWMAEWSDRLNSHLNVYFSNYDLDALGISESQIQQLFQRNKVDERAVKFHTTYKMSDAVQWQNGLQYIETGITNVSDVTQPPFESNITAVIRKYAPYSQISYRTFENRFIATGGVRANYLINLASVGAHFKELLIEPRLNLNFRVGKNLRAQLLGEFKSQTTNQIIDLEQNFLGIEKRRWTLSDEENLPITKSKQGSLGLNYENNGLYVGLEGFYKYVEGISVRTQGFQNEGQFDDEIGRYNVKGVEFLVNKKGRNYSTWLSYTYNKNDYTFEEISEKPFPNNLDIRHSLTLASTLEIKPLKLALGINYRTGKPYTEPDEGNPLNEATFPGTINYESANSSRLPEYFRADASAIYEFNLGQKAKANVGVSFLNITNRKNILNKYYRISDSNEIETVENKSLGLTPNVSFRVSF